MYTFVTGGFRSGRSNYALRRAAELGAPPWLYVSTGRETDEAVRKRIERHRRDIEAIWRVAVMPPKLHDLLKAETLAGLGAAVFDGLAAWIEEHLAASPPDKDASLLDEITEFADRLYRSTVPIVLTSTEMSLGMEPADASDKRLLKIVSSANQILGAQATGMVMMVSGVPLKVR
ncbi:MAG TPA: bifunctional adenosylcobinamide kinase/adenosylcobinamide-phosphate guanylyltransferase [Polyangia bacterium]|nr:bifunctional adenosylcobinamide kinase/adenosylcobinamide-phosphate guanylyltransferase [Polyangia bacterium]